LKFAPQGPGNIRHDPGGAAGGGGGGRRRRRGYDWVGWKRLDDDDRAGDGTSGASAAAAAGVSSSDFVELVFHFDAARNFSAVTFHASNAFSRDVRLFRAATFRFEPRPPAPAVTSLPVTSSLPAELAAPAATSLPTTTTSLPIASDSERRQSARHSATTSLPVTSLPAVEFSAERDDASESARDVTVPLRHAVGQRVVARLYFDARWIIISEVQFQSGAPTPHFIPPTNSARFALIYDC